MSLKTKIKQKEAQIGVIGLGYVGLPLAVEFAKAGFSVTGIDIDESKVAGINAGENYIPDIVVLLQATSPLRKHNDINEAVKKFI